MSEPTTDELERVRAAIRELPTGRDVSHGFTFEGAEGLSTFCTTDGLIALEAALAAAEERERVLREALEEARDWMGCMCGEVGVCADCAMESRLQAALAAASR